MNAASISITFELKIDGFSLLSLHGALDLYQIHSVCVRCARSHLYGISRSTVQSATPCLLRHNEMSHMFISDSCKLMRHFGSHKNTSTSRCSGNMRVSGVRTLLIHSNISFCRNGISNNRHKDEHPRLRFREIKFKSFNHARPHARNIASERFVLCYFLSVSRHQ